jgi:hypothetical protein
MTRNRKIFIAAAAAAAIILIIIGIASCSAQKRPESSSMGLSSGGYTQSGFSSCVPPMACGPSYAGYIPPYYAAHPSLVLLSPYSSYYTPSFNGRSYTTVRTPIGKAPVTSRTPMPYPPGYKPVPGDFQPPTAPAKASVPTSASRPSFKAPDPVKAPAVTTPKYSPPKYTAPKFTAPKPSRRK